MKKEDSPYFVVQSVDRAFSIFELFVKERKPLGISEIAKELKLHKSVVHRLLATMEVHHLLEQLPESGKYQVGPKAFELGTVYMNNALITEGRRFLPELARETNGSAHLGILHQGSVLYLVNQVAPKSVRMQAPIGVRKHVSTTALGKALLAWMEPAQAEQILRAQGMLVLTPHSIPTVEAYLEELTRVRETGYALDKEESSIGFHCVAVPVRDHTGEVVAAISMGERKAGVPHIEETVDIVRRYAEAISESLGYVPKPMF